MNLNELRERVNKIKKCGRNTLLDDIDYTTLGTLIDLAEDVIRLHGVMPEKYSEEIIKKAYDSFSVRNALKMETHNKTIDDCIKAQAGKEIVK